MSSENWPGVLVGALITLGVLSLIFLALREVVCWYWKINQGISLLQEQTKLLKEIRDTAARSEQDGLEHRAAKLRYQAEAPATPPVPSR
jgi:hypothetical protein